MIPSLKFDPNLPHHYIICVGVRDIISKNAGELYLKFRPLYFTNDDIERMRNAAMLSHDKLLKTSEKDCLKIFNVEELFYTLSSMKLACIANNVSMFHFSMESVIDSNEDEVEKYFERFVYLCNTNKEAKEKLFDARI